jgi:alanyl-tRNA synthetase
VTERLYLQDPYRTEFEAEIVERRRTSDGPAVVFERTYFYPESGGQPYDLGTIGGVPVKGVFEADGVILHLVERFPHPDRVHCRIDWDRRRDHMQQHSGQHILSAAFVREAGAQTTSFHLGSSISTIDLDKADLSEEDVARAERSSNEAVRRALPIASRFVAGKGALSLDLRKAPAAEESLRIVEVEGFDRQACCGTHPRSTAEVGPIVARSFERFRGGTRVEFLCGERVLRDYRTTVSRIRSLASVLSSSEAELVSTAEKREEDRRLMGKEIERLRSEILPHRVESWMSEATGLGPNRLLAKVLDASPSELRAAATELTKKPGRIVLLGSLSEGRAHLVFAASESMPADMGALLKACLGEVEGRGGGSARIAQGGGPRTEGLKAALDRASEIARYQAMP